jgi:hypothetical protein
MRFCPVSVFSDGLCNGTVSTAEFFHMYSHRSLTCVIYIWKLTGLRLRCSDYCFSWSVQLGAGSTSAARNVRH